MVRRLCLTLLGGVILNLSASAQLSTPFTGTAVTNGEFYLYNVKSGLWLQNNDSRTNEWTTRANVGIRGINFNLVSKDGGYMIGGHFNDRPSIWPHDNYLDYHDEEMVWNFEPVNVAGLSNVYRIVYHENDDNSCKLGTVNYNETWKANNLFTQEGDGRWYLENVYFWNVDMGEREYWQVVSRDERIAWMRNVASASNPVDASWLIDDPDFSMNNDRFSSWNLTDDPEDPNGNGSREGGNANSRLVGNENNDSSRGNAVFELWRNVDRAFDFYQELTNIPNGIYQLQVQGFCRDGELSTGDDGFKGAQPAEYYAGSVSNKLKTFSADAKTESTGDWDIELNGKYYPNATEKSSRVINREKAYVNDPITVVVTDGSLRIGVRKDKSTGRKDWTVIDNFKLTYLGTVENNTKELYEEEKNNSINASFAEPYEPSDGDENYLAKLRVARKILHAERHDYPFTSADPEDGGNYYLYNVGQKQFFCGGAKWGAHAALGWPGIEVTLNAAGDRFTIDTHLNNGGNSQWLNWQAWCDTGNQDGWKFEKLANGNYLIRAADVKFILGFYPDQALEGNYYFAHVNDYSTDNDWVSEEDLNNQWMLVTKAQRDALLEEATESNPIDASHLIKMPNFSQREYVFSGTDRWNDVENGGAWNTNGSIYERGTDHEDFSLEGYNMSDFTAKQTIANLPPGKYKMTLNGYYRDRGHDAYYGFIDGGGTPSTPARLYVNSVESATLSAIETGKDGAPGLGTVTNYGEYPNNPYQATQYFQNGYYQAESSIFEIGADGTLTFEVKKDGKPNDGDWVVVDNFRLIYLGGTLAIASGTTPSSDRVDLEGSWNKTKFAEIDNEYKALVYSISAVSGIGTNKEVTTTNPNALFVSKDGTSFSKNTIKWDTTGATTNYTALTPIAFTDGYELNTNTFYNFTANQGVTYTRPNVNMQNYATAVVPFGAPVPNGFKAYGIAAEEKNGQFFITFSETTALEAGKPYLLRPVNPSAGTQTMTIAVGSGESKTVAFGLDSGKYARGTYSFMRPNDKNYYGVSNSPASEDHIKLSKLSDTGRISPFRIYFEVPAEAGGKINITFEEATGIRQATTEEIGRLFDIYSVNGQIVKKNSDSTLGLPAGVYIVNGKKVVVK